MVVICKGICNRFPKNIARWRGRTSTGSRQWKGAKNAVYDDRVYDFRVMRTIGHGGGGGAAAGGGSPHLSEEYTRCTRCEIVLLRTKFPNICPCCGNTNLTRSFRRGGRH